MKVNDALRQVLFLKTVPEEALSALIAAGEERKLQKGESLF